MGHGGDGRLGVRRIVMLQEPIAEWYHMWRLSSDDLGARQSAAETLAEMGSRRGLPRLKARFEEETAGQRGYLVRAILRIDPAAASFLLAASADAADRVPVRLLLLKILKDMGPKAPPAAAAIAPLLYDTEFRVRLVTAPTLEAIGPGAEPAIPKLAAQLHDPDENFRWAAAEALAAVQHPAHDRFPEIIDAIRDGRLPLRRMILTLARIALVDKELIRPLIQEVEAGKIETDVASREDTLTLLRKFVGESG